MMTNRKKHGNSRSDAIRSAFGRLGWHAKPRDVVAMLANYGVDVSEGIVQRIKMNVFKNLDCTQIRALRARKRDQQKVKPFAKKIPTRRTYHR